MTRADQRGVALVESLIALVILATAAVSAVTWVASVSRDLTVLQDRQRESQKAERILIATALLTRAELGQRIGERPMGDYLLRVDRPESDLFRIAVSLASAPTRELVATVVYRPS